MNINRNMSCISSKNFSKKYEFFLKENYIQNKMATNGYGAHISADFVTLFTMFMYELQGSLITSQNNVLRTRHNGDDAGSTVRTRPCTTTIHTVRRNGFYLLEVQVQNGPHSLIITIHYTVAII